MQNPTHIIAAGCIAVFATLLIEDYLAPVQSPYITVHSLEPVLADGEVSIRQDRTIVGRREVTIVWQARFFDGTGVDVCSGSGFWDYPTGRRAPEIEIDQWAGDDCLSQIDPSQWLTGCASWSTADRPRVSLCTPRFRVLIDDNGNYELEIER